LRLVFVQSHSESQEIEIEIDFWRWHLLSSTVTASASPPSPPPTCLRLSYSQLLKISLAKTDVENLPHLIRWADYIQNVVDFGGSIEKIQVNMVPFTPHAAVSSFQNQSLKKNEKAKIEPLSKKEATVLKNTEKPSTSSAPEKVVNEIYHIFVSDFS
jgi:hypothetical protein